MKKRHLFVALIFVFLARSEAAEHGACTGRPIPQFQDVTTAAKVNFQHNIDLKKDYIPDSMSGGVLLIDYDRDGWLDIYFTNSPSTAMIRDGRQAPSALYHNNHDGTFTDVAAKSGVQFPCAAMGGAVGDYNNDGWPDMAITCLQGVVLYKNNGDGTFTDVAQKAGLAKGRWSTGAAFADYDGDGYVDLIVASYVSLNLDHPPQPGSSSTCTYHGAAVQCGPHGLPGGKDTLFHNNGNGTFTDVSERTGVSDNANYYGLGVLWDDFDGSGLPSLFVANDSTPNYLYRNLGQGRFVEVGLEAGVAFNADGKEQANMGITAGDYLHTGRDSLYVTTFSDEGKPLYRNDGGWHFRDVAGNSIPGASTLPLLGWGTDFADFDNDGWLDLMTVFGHVYPQVDTLPATAGYRETKTILLNNKDGTFCDATDQSGPPLRLATAARGLAVGDLFNDGNLDAVIENIDGAPLLLRNHGVAGRHWIELDLVGTGSNRLAIGAELRVTAEGVSQTLQIRSGGSYLSQNDLRAHFGLDSAKTADEVRIRWPSGRVETLHHLSADRIYSVLEGEGIVDAVRVLSGSAHH